MIGITGFKTKPEVRKNCVRFAATPYETARQRIVIPRIFICQLALIIARISHHSLCRAYWVLTGGALI